MHSIIHIPNYTLVSLSLNTSYSQTVTASGLAGFLVEFATDVLLLF